MYFLNLKRWGPHASGCPHCHKVGVWSPTGSPPVIKSYGFETRHVDYQTPILKTQYPTVVPKLVVGSSDITVNGLLKLHQWCAAWRLEIPVVEFNVDYQTPISKTPDPTVVPKLVVGSSNIRNRSSCKWYLEAPLVVSCLGWKYQQWSLIGVSSIHYVVVCNTKIGCSSCITESGDWDPNIFYSVHLIKPSCLPILTYGCEVWTLSERSLHTVSVVWNNIIVLDGFLGVVGERALDPYSITVMFCQCHI